MPEQELRSAAEDHGPLQDVLQLAHVTPPWLGGQGPQRLGLDAGERPSELVVEAAEEMRDQ